MSVNPVITGTGEILETRDTAEFLGCNQIYTWDGPLAIGHLPTLWDFILKVLTWVSLTEKRDETFTIQIRVKEMRVRALAWK